MLRFVVPVSLCISFAQAISALLSSSPAPVIREAVSHEHNKWLLFDQISTTPTVSLDDRCKTLLSISVASLH
jgi:hypothetical protein